MEAKKIHSGKKKWLVYLALGLLSLLLVNTFRADIGNMFHAASHMLTGSDYSHTHSLNEKSYNQNSLFLDEHDHKLLAFLHLMDHTNEMPIHSNNTNSLKLIMPDYACLVLFHGNRNVKNSSFLLYEKTYLAYPPFIDILTPPPKV